MLPNRTSRTPIAYSSVPTVSSATASWQSSLYGPLPPHALTYETPPSLMPPSMPPVTTTASAMWPSPSTACHGMPARSSRSSHAFSAAIIVGVGGHENPTGTLSIRIGPRNFCVVMRAPRDDVDDDLPLLSFFVLPFV